MKKYLLIGDNVISKNDRDRHYINAHVLMRLYGLGIEECYLSESHDKIRIEQYLRHNPNLIILHPKYSGEYSAPNELFGAK